MPHPGGGLQGVASLSIMGGRSCIGQAPPKESTMFRYAAMVLAAGRSTRMKSSRSKLLHPVCGVPIIQRLAQTVKGAGIGESVLVVGHQKESILTAYRATLPETVMADQGEPLGTGHAVKRGLEALPTGEREIIILAGDVPLLSAETLIAFIAHHEAQGGLVTVMSMEPQDPFGYGRMIREGERLRGIVEQQDLTPEQHAVRECNGGIYIVNEAFLRETIERIGNHNSQGEFYLTDLVALVPPQQKVATFLVPEEELLGVNTRHQLARAQTIAQERICARLMSQGVTLLDPSSVEIEEGVTVGPDTVLKRGVCLRGESVVGRDCLIDQGAHITDSTIGNGVVVKPYSVLQSATLGEIAEVGPFSHLRPGSELRRGAKVGNFVETKKSLLHEGVKANHLSYLGDAEVGPRSNIGAGTITCNYDGVSKSKTTLGAEVFVGSDSQLIAPVSVGDGAYVGTGTTVFHDVPPGALVVNPKKQRVTTTFIPPKERKQ